MTELSDLGEVSAIGERRQSEHLRDEMSELHARFCRGLGDPKRLLIIAALQHEEQSVGALARHLGATHSNVSQHLAMMRDVGLVVARRVDNNVYYRLSDPRIAEVVDLLRAIQADLGRRNRRTSAITSPVAAHRDLT
jgi:DNA-binding transcriptional ArsR family regulator